jgi:hypothetical protein
MRYLRHTLSLGLAVLIVSAIAGKAEQAPKMKSSDMKTKMDQQAEQAESGMRKSSGQMEAMEKQQLKKAEQVRKETGKGSEQGQSMREEHSRKWWKFWGEKEPVKEPAVE